MKAEREKERNKCYSKMSGLEKKKVFKHEKYSCRVSNRGNDGRVSQQKQTRCYNSNHVVVSLVGTKCL